MDNSVTSDESSDSSTDEELNDKEEMEVKDEKPEENHPCSCKKCDSKVFKGKLLFMSFWGILGDILAIFAVIWQISQNQGNNSVIIQTKAGNQNMAFFCYFFGISNPRMAITL